METAASSQRLHRPSYALVYAAIIPVAQDIARKHGYALAVHGSMATDLDLLACPWVENASDPETLIEAIRKHFQMMVQVEVQAQPEKKPHGRLGWSLMFDPGDHYLPYGGPYLDISVMPKLLQSSEI